MCLLTFHTWPCKSHIFTAAKAWFSLNALCCAMFSLPGKKVYKFYGIVLLCLSVKKSTVL